MDLEIVYRGFVCLRASKRDRLTRSDEPYFIFSIDDGASTQVRRFGPYQGIRTGDGRAPVGPIDQVIWRLSAGQTLRDIWLVMTVAEEDGEKNPGVVEAGIQSLFAAGGGAIGKLVSTKTGLPGGDKLFGTLGSAIGGIVMGAKDDHVGTTGLVLTRAEIEGMARRTWQTRHSPLMDFNIALTVEGGDAGAYIVYLHLRRLDVQVQEGLLEHVRLTPQGGLRRNWLHKNRFALDNAAIFESLMFGYSRHTGLATREAIDTRGLRLEDFYTSLGNHQSHLAFGPLHQARGDERMLVSYALTEGSAALRTPDLTGLVGSVIPSSHYAPHARFSPGSNFSHMVSGRFSQLSATTGLMDVLFYDSHSGRQAMYAFGSSGARRLRTNFNNWLRHWHLVVPLQLSPTDRFTSLLLCTRGDPNNPGSRARLEVWRTTAEGNIGSAPVVRASARPDWEFGCQVPNPDPDEYRVMFWSRARKRFETISLPSGRQVASHAVSHDIDRIVPHYSRHSWPMASQFLFIR